MNREGEGEGRIICPSALRAAYAWNPQRLSAMNCNKTQFCKWIVFSFDSSFKGVLPGDAALTAVGSQLLNNGNQTALAIPEEHEGSDIGGWRGWTSFRGKTIGLLP